MLGAPRNDRLGLDAYFTIDAPKIAPVLLAAVGITGPILEPCAGRGHLSVELANRGFTVVSRDIVTYPNPLVSGIELQDVMTTTSLAGFAWVVSNLPYDEQDRILGHLLPIAAAEGVGVAVLTRAMWHWAARDRRDLVHRNPNFLGIAPLPLRPRWFVNEGDDENPRHDFCWCIWSPKPRPTGIAPSIFYPTTAFRMRKGGRRDR